VESEKIEIRPEVTMLGVLRHLNYKPWFAIAEFVDNALQSFLVNKDIIAAAEGSGFRLKVAVTVSSAGNGEITVVDNAAGISAADFPRAFRAAQIPADRSGLSEFGMGMKSAACWFAKDWSVRTTAFGESVERTIEFNVQKIIDSKIEALAPKTESAAANAHYTVVTLRGLHHPPASRTISKIREHLASIYRVFLANGTMELKFNGEALVYETPKILECPIYVAKGVPSTTKKEPVQWIKNIDFDFGEGQSIRGFAALREVGSTSSAGFALFRRGRLIEGSCDDTYRPSQIFGRANSYTYQRLFGELHVEGFAVSHTKDGFRWEEYEDVFLDCLKEAVESPPLNLTFQAENYRALPTRKSLAEVAQVATNAVAAHLTKDVAPVIEAAQSDPQEPTPIPPQLELSENLASERTVTINDGVWAWDITLRTTIEPSFNDWLSISKFETVSTSDATRRIEIELSLAHPFSLEYLGTSSENVEVLLKIAAAISISLILSQDVATSDPATFLHFFNNLLRGAVREADLNG
jgi:hypothetical protein